MKAKLLLLPLFFLPVRQTGNIRSSVHIVDVATGGRKTIFSEQVHLEAPNWSRNGSYLLVNSKGLLYKLKPLGGKLEKLDIGTISGCNNDHGFSFDGKWLAISHAVNGKGSHISILPAGGGEAKRVTKDSPSYWHGWSPDGKTLAYCAERNGNFDVYTIAVNGGEEKRLTKEAGLDDGPEYSPDGKYIYFNSFRSGTMQIWRMRSDGSQPEQITTDSLSNWFAHLSPGGKQMAYISYLDDQGQNHPFGKRVKLRLMDLSSKKIRDLTPEFFGGQGSFNVPSWSPDGKKLAYVSYEMK